MNKQSYLYSKRMWFQNMSGKTAVIKCQSRALISGIAPNVKFGAPVPGKPISANTGLNIANRVINFKP